MRDTGEILRRKSKTGRLSGIVGIAENRQGRHHGKADTGGIRQLV